MWWISRYLYTSRFHSPPDSRYCWLFGDNYPYNHPATSHAPCRVWQAWQLPLLWWRSAPAGICRKAAAYLVRYRQVPPANRKPKSRQLLAIKRTCVVIFYVSFFLFLIVHSCATAHRDVGSYTLYYIGISPCLTLAARDGCQRLLHFGCAIVIACFLSPVCNLCTYYLQLRQVGSNGKTVFLGRIECLVLR